MFTLNFNKYLYLWFIVPLFQFLMFLIAQNSGTIFPFIGGLFYPYLMTISLPIFNLIGFFIIVFVYELVDEDISPVFQWLFNISIFLLSSWASLQYFSDLTHVLTYSTFFVSEIILYFIISFFIYLSYLMIVIVVQDDEKSSPLFVLVVSLFVYIFGTPWFISLIQF
jgi:hypothetical protein